MTPYSGPKLSDFYTLSQTKLLENHTLHNGTYLYIPYMAAFPLMIAPFLYGKRNNRSRQEPMPPAIIRGNTVDLPTVYGW